VGDEDRPFHNPFAALQSLKDRLPAAPAPAPVPATPSKPAAKPAGKYARAVVRMERSGRGGKEVTVIEQIELSSSEREKWLKELKATLGCGGVIEGENLVLQGDHRKRLPTILGERGVRKVITS
jgi:translation initiation factor 1